MISHCQAQPLLRLLPGARYLDDLAMIRSLPFADPSNGYPKVLVGKSQDPVGTACNAGPPLHTSGMDSSERETDEQQPGQPRARADVRRGRTPWFLTLLLVAGFVGLIAGLTLLWVDQARAPTLLTVASPTAPPVATALPTQRAAPTPLPAGLRFALDPATIEYVPRVGRCDWQGLAGRVELDTGAGAPGLHVHVKHAENSQEFSAVTDAGGNFELRLGDVPLLAPWLVQVQGPDGVMLSEVTQIVTSGNCNQNLMVLIFSEQG